MGSSTYHHLVDSVYDVVHLVSGDVAIIVDVVEPKRPWNYKTGD